MHDRNKMSKMDNSKHRLLMLMLDNSQLGTTVSWRQQSIEYRILNKKVDAVKLKF